MYTFTTKAETLQKLRMLVEHSKVLPQVSFTVGQYMDDPCLPFMLLEEAGLVDQELIVRSSAINEDTTESSNAGKFLSVGNVCGEKNILSAVAQVVSSMGTARENQVFIQPFLKHVTLCGVAFTTDPNTLGNYYVINYDDTTGSTSSVTDGTGTALKTFYCFKTHWQDAPLELRPILAACVELEKICQSNTLDIEFAVVDGTVYLLQARPLILHGESRNLEEQEHDLSCIYRMLRTSGASQPNVLGDKAIYGVMPDWNPAEMIGIRPHPLALSLYQEIITNGVWAYQRDNYGYRNLRSFPLMLDFCGLPYIDTRASFNSFVPKALPEDLAQKLVNYYLFRLQEDPSKHDKVEFEIAFTCYTLDIQNRVSVLEQYGFSETERKQIVDSLRDMTNTIIDNERGLWKKDMHKIEILTEMHHMIMQSTLEPIAKIYWLLEYCKRYGTLPFAGLARAGFIAVEFLKSMVGEGLLDNKEKDAYMNSLSTVGKNISQDITALSPEAFQKKYGHLRPGTYDICSPRYDQAGEQYFNSTRQEKISDGEEDQVFRLTIEQFSRFQQTLDKHGLQVNVLEMFHFIKQAIEGREYSKFVFTHTLSDVLELLAQIGEQYGFSREEMSYIEIQPLLRSYVSSNDVRELLQESILQGKKKFARTSGIVLPPLIWSPEQAYSFFFPDGVPNFITQKSCTGQTVSLPTQDDISGKIVLIRSADPGYDWIFSHGIVGFITAYGGANSHMAIRSAEFGIPAVIGVGEKLFQRYAQATFLTIDCQKQIVTIHK